MFYMSDIEALSPDDACEVLAMLADVSVRSPPRRKLCCGAGCFIEACYQVPGKKELRFCALHRPEDAVDVKNRSCEECSRRPTFGDPCSRPRRPRFCARHRRAGMINVSARLCAHENGCPLRPAFNFPTESTGMFCRKHQKAGMCNVVSKLCQQPGCQRRPSFGWAQDRCFQYCAKHQKTGMVNLKTHANGALALECAPASDRHGSSPRRRGRSSGRAL